MEEQDWKRTDREPSPLDYELIAIILTAKALYEIIEKYPENPEGESEIPWFLFILNLLCKTQNNENQQFKDDVILKYLNLYGLDQILGSHSVNVEELKEHIAKMNSEDTTTP